MSLLYTSQPLPRSCACKLAKALPTIRLCSRLAPLMAVIWPFKYSCLASVCCRSKARYSAGVRVGLIAISNSHQTPVRDAPLLLHGHSAAPGVIRDLTLLPESDPIEP